MRHRHAIRLDRVDRLAEEALPRKAAGHFNRDVVLGRFRGHIRIADYRGDAEPVGERAAECGVGICLNAANVMIEVRESGEHQLATRRELVQQEDEPNRVRPARYCGNDASFGRPERMPGRIPAHSINETGQTN
jgi:hypothetical protein